MQNFVLTAKNAQGENSNQPLPTIQYQTVWDKNTQQLAVMFDLKVNGQTSPDTDFLPNFSQHSQSDILALQQDFLWETHCYELFLAFSDKKDSPYLEVNFSPNGAFNLYQFDSYRTPSQLPPRRLAVSQNELTEVFNVYRLDNQQTTFWHNPTSCQQALKTKIEQDFVLAEHSYRLVMMLGLVKLSKKLNATLTDKLWLNPCAVFNGKKEIAYFAHQHANPPDFHDKHYWIKVDEL